MKEEFRLYFHTPEDVADFVNIVSDYENDMDLVRGRFVVDAKSVLGIMNIGIKTVTTLCVYAEDCEPLRGDIQKYLHA